MAKSNTQVNRLTTPAAGGVLEYVITYFVPSLQPLLQRHPTLFGLLGILLAVRYFAQVLNIRAGWSQFASFFVSTVEISNEEDVFHHLTAWIAEQNTLRQTKKLYAMSNRPTDSSLMRRPQNPEQQAIIRLLRDDHVKYEQAQGLQIFMHKRHLFFIARAPTEGHTYYASRSRRNEFLSISCLGRSLSPIQALVDQVYRSNREKEKAMTIIRRPYSGAGGRVSFNWSRFTAKLPRELNTVILDSHQKDTVLNDITEYMTDATRAFYADHGIPYRRGYMFHGPPGTGKTSFCLALAAHFHLDVYILTLLDHNIQDSDLMSLMNQLPTPSILLLEDVDTAGLSRKKQVVETSDTAEKTNVVGTNATDAHSQALQIPELEDEDEDQNKPSTKISLSGLLNAIDGVAAPEGHILVMTTNRPHDLDDALARAGRVNVTVPFTNATKKQAEELFVRMYVDHSLSSKNEEEKLTETQLAQSFAEQIPEGQFSPAAIQDYLLIHKHHPKRATDCVEGWVSDKQAEQKRKREARQARRYRMVHQPTSQL